MKVNRKNIELEGTKVRLKLMERNVTISGDSAGGSSSRTNSPRGGPSSTARSSLSSSRVSSPIGQNRGSEEKSTLSASTNAINSTTSSSNGRSENRVHFDLKNSDIMHPEVLGISDYQKVFQILIIIAYSLNVIV